MRSGPLATTFEHVADLLIRRSRLVVGINLSKVFLFTNQQLLFPAIELVLTGGGPWEVCQRPRLRFL